MNVIECSCIIGGEFCDFATVHVAYCIIFNLEKSFLGQTGLESHFFWL